MRTTMDLWEDSWETPFLTWNTFSQRIQNYTKFATINLCRKLNGRPLAMALHLSFTVLMQISISATWYFSTKVLTTILTINSSLMESNSISIKIVCTILLPLEYNFIIIFSFLLNCLAVRIRMYWTFTIFMPQDMVIKNCMLFTKITSYMRVTYLCNINKYMGIET